MRKKIKLGITYSLFSGEELLRGSINSIRSQVDYINVVYQDYSWTGNKVSDNVVIILNELLKEGLIDNVIKFENKNNKKSNWMHYEVCKKKNLGIKDLIKNKCTHCMIMDVDEFYKQEEFRYAKEFIFKHNITFSCCSIYDYKMKPIYRAIEENNYAVPFIMKLRWWSRLIGHVNTPCRIDNLRAFPLIPIIDRFYYLNCVNMHHMTGIRIDIESKLENTISNMSEQGRVHVQNYREKHKALQEMSEEEFLQHNYIKVEDIFHLMDEK